jgi:hypothetical protein
MKQVVEKFPRVRYLCGLEESWDQPTYIYPLREEDSGWTTVSRRKRSSPTKARPARRSGPSAAEMVNELRSLTQ